jgi:uncharacterized SAM-binding protein YcdF (DUF218 family)
MRCLCWRIVLVATAGLCIVVIGIFLGVGHWLVVEDPLEKAHAIVVLSGRMPLRAQEAAKLYRGGYAPEIWLTRPREPTASLQTVHIAYLGEDFYNTRVLMQEGVPSTAIHVLEPDIDNTADEMRTIVEELRRKNRFSVIIVTSKVHTRRVRTLWRKLSAGYGRAFVHGAQADAFDPPHWWRTSKDALDVVREVLGLLNAWAGLPLRPST